ncbi:hypothetical protein LINPERPRIM_LOCUS29560, partial [Linum perenne]
NKGIRKLCIQTDSWAAVAILEDFASLCHRHSSLVDQFHDLKCREWEVSIHHIFREANHAADLWPILVRILTLGHKCSRFLLILFCTG